MKWSSWGLHYPISDPHIIWSCFTKCHQYPMYLAFIPLSIPYWLKPCGRRYANLLSPHLERAKIEANLSDNGVVDGCWNPELWRFFTGKVMTRWNTWWLIPLSKWVITPVISGLTLLIPFITGVITHLLSGMGHQVGFSMVFQTPIGMPWYAHLRFQRDRVRCYMRWGTFYFEEFRQIQNLMGKKMLFFSIKFLWLSKSDNGYFMKLF